MMANFDKIYQIGVDCDGGDNGAKPIIDACFNATNLSNSIKITLYGNEISINQVLNENKISNHSFTIVPTKEVIEMNDHPVLALRSKINSSVVLAGNDLNNNKIDAFISSGSTGALVALSQIYIKSIDGIDRPAIATIVPTAKKPSLIIDCGSNVDSKPEYLYQFALLGLTYMKEMMKVENPTVGLLSVGTEENKGNNLTHEAYKLIKNNSKINFIGNIEARQIPEYICDVIVTDGFSGNVFLKSYEGVAKFLLDEIKNTIKTNPITMIGGLLLKNTLKNNMKRFDATNYGGAPILGAKKLILKCHGNAKEKEIYNAIIQAKDFIDSGLNNKISHSLV